MHDALPPWTDLSFDQPPKLAPSAEAGRLVVVIATPRALETGWPTQGVVDLCVAWRAQGHRVVLADGGVGNPSLHGALGVPNAEGLTDSVRFGASPGRVTAAAGDPGLLFISAGTMAAQAAAVFGTPRWTDLVLGFRQAGAALVLYLPADEVEGTGPLDQADDIVILGAVGEQVSPWAGDPARVRALIAPSDRPEPT